MLDKKIQRRYAEWMESPIFDENTKAELAAIEDEKEIEDRFYCDLSFGTSGMRGKLGAGTNRMNLYLIRKLSQSLGQVICDCGSLALERGVVIAFDSRRFSYEFALETSHVQAASKVRTNLFESLRPTPELSFSVRYNNAIAGVMITASHNPKEYNGYKVYWEDGAQISPEQAQKIADKMEECSWDVPSLSQKEALSCGLLQILGKETDICYLNCVSEQMLQKDLDRQYGKDLCIVYTPLHGAGRSFVEHILKENGFSNVMTVPEQSLPDPSFSSAKSPNPEEADAWILARKYAIQTNADLLIATDPDSDRLGVQCKDENGGYYHLTGNQTGILLSHYIALCLKEKNQLNKDCVLIQSIVSTAFTQNWAEQQGLRLLHVPVGFKFIGKEINKLEETKCGTFFFGFEESLGYLRGTYTRDKDAVLGAALIAEAALYFKIKEGKTLLQVLEELFSQYGYFLDEQVSYTLEGKAGKKKIYEIMQYLESDTRTVLGGQKVTCREYYEKGIGLTEGRSFELHFPKINILGITFENGGFIKARPSGTEPKIRFYFCIAGTTKSHAEENLAQIKAQFFRPIENLLK